MQDFYTYDYGHLKVYQTPNLWSTYQSYNYILSHDSDAVIFDPGDTGPILNTIKNNSLTIRAIYLTHHHGDHVGACEALQKETGCEVWGFKKDENRLPPLTHSFKNNEQLDILGEDAEVIHLPGHTLGLCAFYFKKAKLLFSNDHIFSLGCGRVFEGTMPQMQASLAKVRALPDDTNLFPSHEYTLNNLEFSRHHFPGDTNLKSIETEIRQKVQNKIPTVPVTLGFEKQNNVFLRWDEPTIKKALDMEEAEDWQVFAELRQRKDQF